MFTLDELRRLGRAKPEDLPVIYVHTNETWKAEPMIDTKNRLHMCEADMWKLKQQGVPVIHVAKIGPSTEEFKLEPVTGFHQGDLDPLTSAGRKLANHQVNVKHNEALDKVKEDEFIDDFDKNIGQKGLKKLAGTE